MTSTRRPVLRALVALLLVSLTVPAALFAPDPATVAAAAARRSAPTSEPAPPAAPGTYRSASSAASVPITAIEIGTPAGTTTNDVLLAMVSVRGAPTIAPPAGWTLVRADTNGTVIKQSLYHKVVTGSEPARFDDFRVDHKERHQDRGSIAQPDE